MEDVELVAKINELAEEEHRLEESHGGQGLSPDEATRLRRIEVSLTQCWTTCASAGPVDRAG